MKPAFQVLIAFAVLFGAGTSAYFGITGILEGAVEFPSKRQSFQIVRHASPKAFWACVAFWLAAGLGLSWLALANFREAARRA